MAPPSSFTQRAGRPDRPASPVRVGSVFGGGPAKLGVHPQAPSQTGQIVPGTTTPVGHHPGTQLAPHPLTGPAPQPLGVPGQASPSTPGPSTAPGPVNPNYDATSLAAIGQNNFNVGNRVNALNMQGGFADTALQTALGNLAYQEPRDQLKAEQAANSRGGLYSTVYDQQLGDLTHSYVQRAAAAQTTHDNEAAVRASQIQGLQGGIPIFNEGQAAATTIREANANQNNPALGQSSKPLVKAAPAKQSIAATFVHNAAKSGAPWAKALLKNPYIMR